MSQLPAIYVKHQFYWWWDWNSFMYRLIFRRRTGYGHSAKVRIWRSTITRAKMIRGMRLTKTY